MQNTDAPAPPSDPYHLSPTAIVAPPETLWAALKMIGPGIILAGSIIGSGELLLTTSLGAEYGFVFLWLILFSCVIKVFVQIELGRHTLSCGKPTLTALNSLPGPRFGAHWLVWWWFLMLLVTVFQLGAMMGGVSQAMHLAFPQFTQMLEEGLATRFPSAAQQIHLHAEYPWAVCSTIVAIVLLLSGGYQRIERVTTFLVALVTSVTVVCVLLLPRMGYGITWQNIEQGFSLEALSLPTAAIGAAFGAFGITGVGASELYAYPYWCIEKGYAQFTGPRSEDPAWADRARGWMRVMHLDAWVSMLVFTVATVAFYILGATVLHRQGLHPQKSEMIATLSEMYVPAFGSWTKPVFLVGVWAVLFKTFYIASASNSRLTADFLKLTGVVHYESNADRTRWIRRACVFYPLLGLALYFWRRDPKGMVVLGGFVQAATLPVISAAALYLRYRRTDPRVLPSRVFDVCLWLAFLSITAVALYAIPSWFRYELWPTIEAYWRPA